jgi:hypothetical protein
MQNFAVRNQETHVVEYVLTFEETNDGKHYQMFRSNLSVWANPGEKIMSAFDDGNCINFNPINTLNSIGYSDFAELVIMYSFINKIDSPLMEKYDIVKEEFLTSI